MIVPSTTVKYWFPHQYRGHHIRPKYWVFYLPNTKHEPFTLIAGLPFKFKAHLNGVFVTTLLEEDKEIPR